MKVRLFLAGWDILVEKAYWVVMEYLVDLAVPMLSAFRGVLECLFLVDLGIQAVLAEHLFQVEMALMELEIPVDWDTMEC